MPLKLTIGFSKKIGHPDYGSLGASCRVEVELAQSLLFDEPEAFQDRVNYAYAACRDAVDEELDRQRGAQDAHHRDQASTADGNTQVARTATMATVPAESSLTTPDKWPARFEV